MAKILLQFKRSGRAPALEEVRALFDLNPDEVDAEFGVVQTDSQEGLYTVLVEEAARERVEKKLSRGARRKDPAVGFFSNPRIEPFVSSSSEDQPRVNLVP